MTWTTPSTSSRSSPITGNREWPVRRARVSTSAALAVRSTVSQRTRGVMTSPAVWSEKVRVRPSSVVRSVFALSRALGPERSGAVGAALARWIGPST